MIAIPWALVSPATEAGIEVPPDPEEYDKEKYPYWHVFLCAQLGAPMPGPTAHWDNAKVIAALPKNVLKTITHEKLRKKGFQVGNSYA